MILLTGATGFLGSNLLEALILNKHEVVILKRTTSDTSRINHLLDKIIFYNIDIQSFELAFVQHKIDVVIHTACNYGKNENNIQGVFETNVIFSFNLLNLSIKYKVATFINTDTLLNKNVNAYSLSKKQFTEWLEYKSYEIQVINLKIEQIYGINDDKNKLIPWVLSEFKNKSIEIALTKGEQMRDFIFIDDVVSAFMLLLEKKFLFKKFNEFDVATGNYITIKSFIELLKKEYENINGKVNTMLSFGKLEYRKNEMMMAEADNHSLIKLGWLPRTNIYEGIKKIII